MVFSELALGFLTNLIYDSSKKIPREIFDTYSKIYEKAIEEFSNKHCKLNGIQIDTFFHQKNVEIAIKKYLKNQDKLDCSNVLIQEFFELFSEEDFSHEDAHLILNTFFEILDTEIEEYPELIMYLDHYLAKRTDKTVQETNQGVKELSQDVREISQTVQEIHKVVSEGREDQTRKELKTDFDESIKKYLNKIIDEEGRTGISEVYTELSAKEILPITLKFRDEEKDKTQEFEVLELVEKEEKLIISGESGSGKTTTLRWLNFTFATKYLENKECSIPLYVELNSYRKSSFYDYFKRQMKKKGLSETALKTLLEGKVIILLDGLDLLSPTENFFPYDEISDFFSDYSNCQIIISSRPGFFESIRSNFKVSELEKLTEEKIEIFIERYVEEKELADTLKDKTLRNQQLRSILSNPMMLYIAIKVAIERKDQSKDLLPSNRSELYEAFISTLFSHHDKKGKCFHADRVQIENALTDLYFELQCKNEVSCKYSEALKIVKKSAEDDTFRKTTSQDILEDCCKIGLLIEKDSEIEYGIHQSFQEYFAAIKLKELFENGIDVSEAFSHPKWEEVVIFTSEILDLDFIDEFIGSMLLKRELFLASKCVNKASKKVKEKLCSLLADKMDSRYELEKRNSIESLGRIGNVGISIIVEALKDENLNVLQSAAEALGNIKSDIAVQPLINAMKNQDSYVWLYAAEALGNIKSDEAVQPLINALKGENIYVRMYAAKALGNIKSETAVQPLINALKDENENVRMRAAEALGNIKSEIAVQPLINALKDEDEDEDEGVRMRAAEALGNIKSETAVQPLINALKDEDKVLRNYVAEALGNIESETAMKLLINALKEENENVRRMVVGALGDIKSEIAVQPLINALKDEDEGVRTRAAVALGNIKSEIAVQPLINALKDEDKYVRMRAAVALGDIKSEAAVQPLINAFKDEDLFVRMYAAEALGNIKSETAIKLLINALKEENEEVRRMVVGELRNIKSETVVRPLISALKDEDLFVRMYAAEALGNTKSEIVVQPLINALKDEDEGVRMRAAEALGNIKSETAVQPLINALKDEDEDEGVRMRAAEALGNIKSEIAVQPLINALKDEDLFVRMRAAEALGNIKSETAVQPLINALKDEDEDGGVRMRVAVALGNIKSEIAVQPLINSMRNLDEDVLRSAAEALGNIKSDEAVQPLINALKGENIYVRMYAAETLGNICTVKNKGQLKDLLESDQEFSANVAFEILNEIEKEERSKLILFKDLKKRSKITPKYSLFVSSVQKELENERVTIQDLVENDPFLSEHYSSLLYEYEPAYPEKTLEGCLNSLNCCQVYLLIVGVKYGTIVGEISITHREYRYAKEKGFPILVFIKGERNIEREQGTEILLKEIDSDDFKYKRFRNVIELKNEVNESLKKLLRDEDRFLKI